MKDFLFQFAEGNQKSVNNSLEVYKVMSETTGICDATVTAIKENIDGIYSIECDFPFLSEGMAKMLKIVCEEKILSILHPSNKNKATVIVTTGRSPHNLLWILYLIQ